MNYIGYTPGHNASITLLQNYEISYYLEEERLSRWKRDGNPFLCLNQMCERFDTTSDECNLALAGTGDVQYPVVTWSGEILPLSLLRKYQTYNNRSSRYLCKNKDINVILAYLEHHSMHAMNAYFNSNLNKSENSLVIVADGMGSQLVSKPVKYRNNCGEIEEFEVGLYESITVFILKNNVMQILFRLYSSSHLDGYILVEGDLAQEQFKCEKVLITGNVTVGKVYEAVSYYLGFPFEEGGKTMGLAPYGQYDENISPLIINTNNHNLFNFPILGDQDRIKRVLPAGAEINCDDYLLGGNPNSKEWHSDENKVTDIAKNLAWRVQHETQEVIVNLIKHFQKDYEFKNVCISGGYGLNCMANYHYRKTFPDLNFWIDPIAHDGGTSMGAAIAAAISVDEKFHEKYKPFKNLYLGPEYSKEEQLEVLNNLPENFEIQDAKHVDIAKLLYNNNIVCLYQGRSEAGPRALGNRSMLYNPCDPNGKDFVNKVKRREWFRPFAGSMLHEHFEEWFDTYGIDETPYMMYAMDVKEDKRDKIPSIVHVDGTCRIQTVKREQNQHYYDLIKEFYKLSGVPIVFNTSFNLGGDPLVETIGDAIHTLEMSDIYYLYLPEFEKLIVKKV